MHSSFARYLHERVLTKELLAFALSKVRRCSLLPGLKKQMNSSLEAYVYPAAGLSQRTKQFREEKYDKMLHLLNTTSPVICPGWLLYTVLITGCSRKPLQDSNATSQPPWRFTKFGTPQTLMTMNRFDVHSLHITQVWIPYTASASLVSSCRPCFVPLLMMASGIVAKKAQDHTQAASG